MLREIEGASRLTATGVVNNSNLGGQTTAQDILDALEYGRSVASLAGIPLVAAAAERSLAAQIPDPAVYPVDLYVLPPWEEKKLPL